MSITEASRTPTFMSDSLEEVMRAAIVGLQERALNYVTTLLPALVIGTGSLADIRVNVAIDYVRDGVRRAQKAVGEVSVPAGASMPNDGTAREVVVLVYIDENDAYVALAGVVATDGETAVIPDLPAGCVQLGHVRIAAAAGTAYVADTTLLNAAGLTVTYTNLVVPSQNWEVPVRRTL